MPKPVNYEERINWIHRPSARECTKSVDVFFAYPTVYVHPDKDRHHLMPLPDPVFRTAARSVTWWKDRMFAETCNVFAPYYRQAGMETLYMPRAEFDRISETPYEDIRDAFFYYLQNCNNGRPFLLGGHSQGSEILIRLMARDFAGLEAASRLIAAYLIGYSVTQGDLAKYPHLRMAQSADDTGVIISYNTSAEGLDLLPVVLPGAVCTNPLSWEPGTDYAPKSMNLGSVLVEAGRLTLEKKHFTGARVDASKGVLMIDTDALEEMEASGLLGEHIHRHRTLHSFDIPLFQRNLEQNIAVRIKSFYAQNPQFGAPHVQGAGSRGQDM